MQINGKKELGEIRAGRGKRKTVEVL